VLLTREPVRITSRRVTLAVAAAGISSFALLYAPQAVLPQLAAEFRLDPGSASLTVSVATGALALAVLPIAVLSEVIGRRPVILASVTGSVVLGLLLPLAHSYQVLLVLRAIQGVAIAGFPGVAAAYLVEQLGRRGVAAAVGAMIAGNTLGGMAGRLVSGFTAGPLGWHGALAAVAGVALVCAVITVVTLPISPVRPASRVRLGEVFAGLKAAVGSRVLLAQYVVATLAMGSFVALYNAAGFRFTGEPLDLSPAIASLVFFAYAVGSVSSSMAGKLVARFGRMGTVAGALITTIAGAALTISDLLPLVVLGFLVLTGGFFAAHAVANGWAASEAPETARGQVSGLYTLAYYLGSSVGGTVGAVIYGRAGWTWLVAFTALLLASAMGAVLTVRPLFLSHRGDEEAAADRQ
jgi:YNFM family putative membrane transporter